MGNRAVIVFESQPKVGVYLHWNGGPESVLAFLEAAKVRGFRDPASDASYALARFVGLLHEFLGPWESTSLGVGHVDTLDRDNYDNGVYYIGAGWKITRRDFNRHDNIRSTRELVEQDHNVEQYQAIFEHLTEREAA